MEILRPGEALSYQCRAYHSPIALDQAPVCLVGKDQLTEGGHQNRIDQACDDCEQDCHSQCRNHLSPHIVPSLCQSQKMDQLVNDPDSRERHDESTKAV